MNPEILPVLDEISAILKKRDMAGLVIVANKTHCDYRMEITPQWTCLQIETPGEYDAFAVHIKASSSVEGDRKKLTDTIGIIAGFCDVLRVLESNLGGLLSCIGKHVDFTHRSKQE